MVGTRRATQYGLDRAFLMAEDLAASGMAVVSGLAIGVDAESHKGALAGGGRTVGIIGSALDEFYPEENRLLAREIVEKGGAVASEFPFGRRPDQRTFPQRNRIVAALSRGVVVVESPLSGGSLITAGDAVDMGITVMAVPGRVDSRSSAGCLKLIRDGAKLVRDARDVLEEIGGLFPEIPVAAPKTRSRRAPSGARNAAALTAEEALLMKHVDAEGVGIDELVRLTGIGAAKVNAAAMTLRIKGRVRFFPGNRIALPRGD
jgi:DNA processing protein